MAYKVVRAKSKPAVTTNTTLYQVTAGKESVLASLRIVNMGAATETVQIGVSATDTPGATEWVFKGTCEVNKPILLSGDLFVGGEYIVVYNATAGNVVFSMSLWETV